MEIFDWIEDKKKSLSSKKEELLNQAEEVLKELEQLRIIEEYLRHRFCPSHYQTVFDKYIQHIQAYCDLVQIDGKDPDESFMRSIEEQIGISENLKKAFREEMLIRISSYSRKGMAFKWDTYERLSEAIKKYCN